MLGATIAVPATCLTLALIVQVLEILSITESIHVSKNVSFQATTCSQHFLQSLVFDENKKVKHNP